MRKARLIIGSISLLLLVYLAATPYITVYQIKKATEQNDHAALAKYINFPAVRQDLKVQLHAKIEKEFESSDNKNPMMQMLGSAFFNSMADKLLESYVTPEAMSQLMAGVDPKANTKAGQVHNSNTDAAFSNAKTYYQSHDTFMVEITTNQQGDTIDLRLSRKGFNWQVTGITLP